MTTITLAWPSKDLSPNARIHWSRKAKAARIARAAAWALTKQQRATVCAEGAVPIWVTFHPPCNRARDRDNMLASVKPHLDGIADALGINDNRFEPTIAVGGKRDGGAVVVVLA